MKFLTIPICAMIFSACTYNVSMVHTEGTASDVIDETTSNEPNVSPNISIPSPLGI